MRIHIKHKWKADGFKQLGSFTKFFAKCKDCEAEFSNINHNRKPPKYTTVLPLLCFLISFILLAIFAYVYINY